MRQLPCEEQREERHRARPELAAFRPRVTVEVTDAFNSQYPRQYGAGLVALTRDGRSIEVAVRDAAEHINKFWDPRMRTALLAHLNAGGEGLDPTIVKTAPLIKPPKLAAA